MDREAAEKSIDMRGKTVTTYIIFHVAEGLRDMKKGYKAKLEGLSRPFSGFARKGLAQAGHIAPQDKLNQLKGFGAKIYTCGPSIQH